MSEAFTPSLPAADLADGAAAAAATLSRKRPRPGERRIQILRALAAMLEKPGADRVTTAALAARLEVSEAALYRHFASKAQMFEGLIDFIEESVFSLIDQILEKERVGTLQAAQIVAMLLHFSERNPGMTRVMVGDALVFENDRLQQRMNLFFDKVEATLSQSLRAGAHADSEGEDGSPAQASMLTAFVVGRMQRYARSGFRRAPSEYLDASLARIL
ncbi:nucleoid occlusion factor SlmA [uncultured Xylophilus sp.]|uniref:nucleoid occlusion factor SlmA n=1 Tax=uncultured Xylophilus sp. TaxID=296832 RepID=UPI0025CC2605|nr:nucleoid occlusion factor SlmA [uncultured Xylophilus sp.]